MQARETGEVLIKLGVDSQEGEARADRFVDKVEDGLDDVTEAHDKATAAAKRQVEMIGALERAFTDARDHARKMVEEIDRLEKANKTADEQIRKLTADVKRLEASLKTQGDALDGVIKKYLSWGTAIAAAYKALDLIWSGLQKNAGMEDMTLGIAGIVATNEKVINQYGQQVEGSKKILAVQEQVRGVIAQIQKDALLSKATTEELVRAFQAAVGPGLAVGLSLEQVQRYAVAGSRALAGLGIPLQQADQELRSILDGTIDINSRLALALQLTNEEVALHKAKGDLFEFLIGKMKDLDAAGQMAGKNFSGLMSALQDTWDLVLRLSTEPLFGQLKEDLDDVLSRLISVDENGLLVVNQDLERMTDFFGELLSDAKDFVVELGRLASWSMGDDLKLLVDLYRLGKAGTAAVIGYPAAFLGAATQTGMPMSPGYRRLPTGEIHPEDREKYETWKKLNPTPHDVAWSQVRRDVLMLGDEKTPQGPGPWASGFQFQPIDKGTNMNQTRREIERVNNLFTSLGTVDGYRKAIAELEKFQKNHKLGSDASEQLTGTLNRLRKTLEDRTKTEQRAADSERKRQEREQARETAAWVRSTRDKSTPGQYAEPIGPETPWDLPQSADLGNRISFIKPWTFQAKTDLGHLGLSGNALGRLQDAPRDPLAFSASEGSNPLPDAKLQPVVGDLLPPDQTADMIRQGIKMAGDVARGDLEGLLNNGAQVFQDAMVKALVGEATQKAAMQLSTFLAGPAGIAVAFGVALIAWISQAGEAARKEAEEFRKHLEDVRDRYGSASPLERLERDMKNDDKLKEFRDQRTSYEKQIAYLEGSKNLRQYGETDKEMSQRVKNADTQIETLRRALDSNAKATEALESTYKTAFREAQTKAAVQDIQGFGRQWAPLQNQLFTDQGHQSQFYTDASNLTMAKHDTINDFLQKNQGADQNVLNWGKEMIAKYFDLQIKLLEEQLATQKRQLELAQREEGMSLDNRLAFLKGDITEQEYNQREGELGVVQKYRKVIQDYMESSGLIVPRDEQLDSLAELRDFIKNNPNLDPNIGANLEKSLAVLAIESQRGSSASNPMWIRDADRDRAFPLDPTIYMRMLSRGAATRSSGPQVLEGGQGTTQNTVIFQGGITVDARGMDPANLDAAVAQSMSKFARSPQGIRTITLAAKNGARNNAGAAGSLS